MTDSFSWDIPDDVLELTDVALAWQMGEPEGATITAKTRVLKYDSRVLLTRVEGVARAGVAVGLRPDQWPIGEAIPVLSHPAIDELKLENVTLVVTDQPARVHSSQLSDAAHAFYKEVYQAEDYELVLTPGLNLIASFPIEGMGADDPLRKIFDRLGMKSGVVLLQGTLGQSLASVGKGAASLDLIRDLYLRASLPKMRPPESPAWFKSGQLALELTGRPSIGFVGEITVDVDGDVLVFMVAAKIEKDGVGAAVALLGGLRTEEPWVHPFDLQWLVFHKTVLKLSVDVKANVGLGFLAKMVIGEKDIDVAAAIKVNASGVPTNFLFDGVTEAGISMDDLVALQAQMRKAKDAAPGVPPPAGLPLDQLPPMEITDIAVKFALKDDPDLEVERGLALRGEFWIQMRPGGEMNNFAGVDFSVDDNGIVGKAHLGAYAIGPVAWDDALLDLELTLERQALMISGAVDFGFARQHVDVSVTRAGAYFETEATLFDEFRAALAGEAPFTVHDPVWSVKGEMENDFNGAVADLVLGHLRAWADEHEQAMQVAEAAYAEAKQRAEAAARRLEQLETALDERQATAKSAMDSAKRAADAAAKAVARAEAAVTTAEATLAATPARNVRQKAACKADVAKAKADLAARRVAHTARQADHAAKKAAFDALSSDAVAAARREAQEAEAAATAAGRRLEELSRAAERIRSGDGTPLVVDRAALGGRLDALSGGTADLTLDMRFLDQPATVALSWDFRRMEECALRIADRLLGLGR